MANDGHNSGTETTVRPPLVVADERLRRAPGGPRGNEYRRTHARYELARLMKALGPRSITEVDRRSRLGRELAERRSALLAHVGEERTTEIIRMIIEQIVRRLLFLESIDAYLFSLPSLVIRRRKCVVPVLQEREALAAALTRDLQAIGLERLAKRVATPGEWLAES